MKKTFLFCSFYWLAIAVNCFAGQVELGIKGGVNFSNIDNTGGLDFGYNTATGYNAGVFADITLNDFLDFQPEFFITQKGNFGVTNSIAPYLNSFSLYYLEFSTLFKTNVFSVQKIKFNLLAGPEVAFPLQVYDPNLFGLTFENTKYSVEYNSFDFGVVLGISLDWENIVLDARYDVGLKGIFNNEGVNGFDFNAGLNRVFMVSAGYKLLKL